MNLAAAQLAQLPEAPENGRVKVAVVATALGVWAGLVGSFQHDSWRYIEAGLEPQSYAFTDVDERWSVDKVYAANDTQENDTIRYNTQF